MTTPRVKTISKTLEEVRASHRFLKVAFKDKVYSTSRVQINGHKTIWAKDPDVVYSPETGLAGRREIVVDYLKSRSDRSDESADEVLREFNADKRLITSKNFEKYADYIEDKTRDRQKTTADEGTGKVHLIPREQIPDLLARVREVRGQVSSSGKTSRADVIGQYLKKIEDGKVFRIHGCTQEGLSAEGKLLRSTTKDGTSSKTSVALGDKAPLSHFYVPMSYDNKRYVVNFMTLYYMHVDQMKAQDAQTKARQFAEDLLVQYKKVRGGRTSSPKPRDASKPRTTSGSRKSRASSADSTGSKTRKSRAASADGSTSPKPRKARDASVSPKTPRAKSQSKPRDKSPSPSKTPRAPRAASPRQGTSSTVQSAGSSRAATPTRSPSPSGTSPKPSAKGGKVFRLPSKKTA